MYMYKQCTVVRAHQLALVWSIFMVIRSSGARLHLLIAFQELLLLLQPELFTI